MPQAFPSNKNKNTQTLTTYKGKKHLLYGDNSVAEGRLSCRQVVWAGRHRRKKVVGWCGHRHPSAGGLQELVRVGGDGGEQGRKFRGVCRAVLRANEQS
jgi:hypothetical protein